MAHPHQPYWPWGSGQPRPTWARNMQHVFISFKAEDLDFAENVIGRLEKEGFASWVDSHIEAGREWRGAIDFAIENAFALIVIMTPEAKVSEYVTYEWAFACGIGVRVVPILLRPTQLHPRLEALQYLDFTNVRSRPWERLIEEIKAASHSLPSHSVNISLNSPPIIKEAVASLDSAVPDERRDAIRTLAEVRTHAACATLRESLKHPFPDVRLAAAEALGDIEDPIAVPALIEALKDPMGSVRSNAAEALGSIKDPSAVPALIEALKDPEEYVRATTAEALASIKDPSAVPALIEALKDPVSSVRASAAKALGAIEDRSQHQHLSQQSTIITNRCSKQWQALLELSETQPRCQHSSKD